MARSLAWVARRWTDITSLPRIVEEGHHIECCEHHFYRMFVPDVTGVLKCIEPGFEKATKEGRRAGCWQHRVYGETLFSGDPSLPWRDITSVLDLTQSPLRRFEWQWTDACRGEQWMLRNSARPRQRSIYSPEKTDTTSYTLKPGSGVKTDCQTGTRDGWTAVFWHISYSRGNLCSYRIFVITRESVSHWTSGR